MTRLLAALVAIVTAANGLAMLFAGRWWYGVVPGVTETGPLNPHFVKDIGAAYLTVGLGFAWLATRPSPAARGAAIAGATFLALHVLIHLAAAATSADGLADLIRDFPGVVVPALIAAWTVWPRRSTSGKPNA
jgi:hypothetical protein